MNKKITWIDLTDLAGWTGHHTGIQRVVYNLAKYFDEIDDSKFFVYDEETKQFYEADFGSIEKPAQHRTGPSRRRMAKERLLYLAKIWFYRLPERWRNIIGPAIVPRMRFWYGKIHHLRAKIQSILAGKKNKLGTPVQFGPEDKVVILGAGWVKPSILRDLWGAKQRSGFAVYHFVHDLIPVYQPHLFSAGHFELFTRYMFEMAAVADKIIVNSKATGRDMKRFLADMSLPELPIEVIRLGDELEESEDPQRPDPRIKPQSFILAVGTIEVRKNHILLYNTYKLAASRGIELPMLVVVGRLGWHAGDVLHLMQYDPQVREKIIILNGASDSELDWLYQNALFSIYPSAYEGWGLPVAESLVKGKLCLTTNSSSMPEIAGNLLDYFDPLDPNDCLASIQKYLDKERLKKAQERIRIQYHPQGWKVTFTQLLKAIES